MSLRLAYTTLLVCCLAAACCAAPAERALVKRCAEPGCASNRLDLSLRRPYVMFILSNTDDKGPEEQIRLDIKDCQSGGKLGGDDTTLQWHNGKGIDKKAEKACQTFVLNELGGFGKTQTYSVQVSATNLFYGWHNKLWSPKFEKLDPLWTPEQQVVFDCAEVRGGEAKNQKIGTKCMIKLAKGKSDKDGPEQLWRCLVADRSGDPKDGGGLHAEDCGDSMQKRPDDLYWNLRDVSSDFDQDKRITLNTA